MPQYGSHPPVHRRRPRALSAILFGIAVLGLVLAFQPGANGQGGPAPGQAAPMPPVQPVQPVTAVDGPLAQPLALMYESRKAFANVRDYTCTLQSRENVRGVLLDEKVMAFKMRTQPFSIYMRWLAPRKDQGQEVCFVLGRNNNKMRVHSTHIGQRIAGFVSIDVNDPRVMEHSRHTIYEAGLGNLIEQTIKHWEYEIKIGKTEVKTGEYLYNNRRCTRIETTRPERIQGFYSYRSVLYVDNETKLPVRTENYDWPRPGGTAGGDLLEMFSFIDIRTNVGLTDQDFNK